MWFTQGRRIKHKQKEPVARYVMKPEKESTINIKTKQNDIVQEFCQIQKEPHHVSSGRERSYAFQKLATMHVYIQQFFTAGFWGSWTVHVSASGVGRNSYGSKWEKAIQRMVDD